MSETLRLRAGALEWREVEGEIAALDVRASAYLAVNRTGASIWPALVQGATREQLASHLEETFDIDRSRAEADVEGFLQVLRERDLLEG